MLPPKLRIHAQGKVVPAKTERKDGTHGSKRSHEDKQRKRIVRFRSVCEEFEVSMCRDAPAELGIERQELPIGSDIFQSILKEIQADNASECSDNANDCAFTAIDSSGTTCKSGAIAKKPTRRNSHLKPKKSILKQSSTNHDR